MKSCARQSFEWRKAENVKKTALDRHGSRAFLLFGNGKSRLMLFFGGQIKPDLSVASFFFDDFRPAGKFVGNDCTILDVGADPNVAWLRINKIAGRNGGGAAIDIDGRGWLFRRILVLIPTSEMATV